MKTIFTVDERNRIEINDFGNRVNMTVLFRTDNMSWVIKGGCLLTREQSANLGLCFIDRSGKEKEILKAKYQRKDF